VSNFGHPIDAVLVVDDDSAMLDLMDRVLAKHGFRPVLCDDPTKAAALAHMIQPDIASTSVARMMSASRPAPRGPSSTSMARRLPTAAARMAALICDSVIMLAIPCWRFR
jgi:CheY-like chemotaxis protein